MSKREIGPASITFGDNTIVEDVDLAEEVVMVDGKRLTDERADTITADVLSKVRESGDIIDGRRGDG
ncbi:hypothetical protein [Mycobacterium sp.]|uniref:hypothetical protein n=1 Tax=Mycobacterium sp. TaxID=1785 RepID=UPI0025CE2591|nr:hypothetical protein [Mycobacterium sp.]